MDETPTPWGHPNPSRSATPTDPVITRGDDAGRLESEVREIVFNSEVSDLDYFLSRKAHHERKQRVPEPQSSLGHEAVGRTLTETVGEFTQLLKDKQYDVCPHQYSEVLSGVRCIKCGHFVGNWE